MKVNITPPARFERGMVLSNGDRVVKTITGGSAAIVHIAGTGDRKPNGFVVNGEYKVYTIWTRAGESYVSTLDAKPSSAGMTLLPPRECFECFGWNGHASWCDKGN